MSVEMKKLILPDQNGNEIEFEVVDDAARGRLDGHDSAIQLEHNRITEIASLNEGSTTGDAELVDIRVSADGTVYGSAGDAVRGQKNFTNKGLEDINQVSLKETGIRAYCDWHLYPIFTNTDPVVMTPGTSNQYYHMIIPCTAGDIFHVKIDAAASTARPWTFVDTNGYKKAQATVNVVDADIIAPTDSAYLIVNSRYNMGFVYGGVSKIESLEFAKKYMTEEKIFLEFTLIAEKCVYDFNGNLGGNANCHATDYIKIPENTEAIESNFYNHHAVGSSYTDGYAFYDENKTYISGGRNPYSATCYIQVPDNAVYIRVSGRTNYEESGVDRYLIAYSKQNYKSNNGKTIVMLGDSLIGNYNGLDSIPDLLSRQTGANCINGAFGGSNMGTDTYGGVNQLLLPFRGFKVIEAIVNNDYTEMLQAIADDSTFAVLRDYYPKHVATLQNIDWDSVDIITFSYGTNDWGTAVTLADNENDLYDTNTFGGAFRTAVETLLTKYPHIKLMMFSPVWRGGTITNGELDYDSDDSPNDINKYLREYVEKEREIAKEYHIPFVDMYDCTNFNKYTWKQYFPSDASNAVHPNANGRRVMAKVYGFHLGIF